MRREEPGMVGGENPSPGKVGPLRSETPGSSPFALFDMSRDAYGQERYEVPSEPEGHRRGREGRARVLANSPSEHVKQLDEAIAALAASFGEFVPEDVRRLLPKTWSAHRNLIGSRMAYWLERGFIKRTGERRPGTAPSQHGRRVDVYRGTE